LPLHCDNVCKKALQSYFIRALPVLLLHTAGQLVGLFFVEMPTEHSGKGLATTVTHGITNVRFALNAST